MPISQLSFHDRLRRVRSRAASAPVRVLVESDLIKSHRIQTEPSQPWLRCTMATRNRDHFQTNISQSGLLRHHELAKLIFLSRRTLSHDVALVRASNKWNLTEVHSKRGVVRVLGIHGRLKITVTPQRDAEAVT